MSDKNTEENVVKNWGEMQQNLLTDWLDTLRSLGGTPTLELWRKTVDTWQSSVKETIDARAEWTKQWTETLAKAKGTPEELREMVREGREQLQHWTEAGVGAKAGEDLIQLWQDSATRMINTQADLVRRWTGGITGTKKQGKTSGQ